MSESNENVPADGASRTTVTTAAPVVVQGEMELIRRYRGVAAEVVVLGLGFMMGLGLLWGGIAVFVAPL